MLTYVKDILENRDDAYARALAMCDRHITESGGTWFGAGMKGCILLMKGGSFAKPDDGLHYIHAGLELLQPALAAAKNSTGPDADTLIFSSGCGFGASPHVPGHYEAAKKQFLAFDGTDDWCHDWKSIILAGAAQATGNAAESKSFFKELSDRDAQRAGTYFELWQHRKDRPQ